MYFTKRLITSLLCVLLCVSTALAQDGKAAPAQAGQNVAQDVMIIIQRQQVRFTAQRSFEGMRLQIFDQSGEMVYDSGSIAGPEVDWSLQNANGETVKSGLYAYTLSIKETGTEKARERRGHFIVDRAQDRDGADKLWVTSQNSGGVGAELTVARDENVTVAGATINNGRSVAERSEQPDRNGVRKVEGETQSQTAAVKEGAAAAAGTAGRIAKFTTATDVGDSVITELNGNIGIGTTAPLGNLHVHGSTGITTTGPGAAFFFRNRETTTNTNYWAWYSQNNIAHFWQSDAGDLINITTSGNIGVGNATPGAKLDVASASNDILRLTSSEPYLTFYDTNHGNARGAIQQVNGGLNLFTDAYLRGADQFGFLRLDTSGNLGVGVANPTSKLQVEGLGPVQLAVNSRNDRAVLALGNTISAGRYIWTLESGVRGIPGLFGIYNPQANKVGLEIDGNMVVSVRVLQITGGADLSEKFDVLPGNNSESAEEIQPGMVVAIDPINPGKLRLSRRAYDRRVAGVISGAGGVQPGMKMGQEGTLADGKHPVALGGRVYVRVDATRGAVKPGDLLTTSATPGYAMKAANASKAQGAIIGKAMTGLKGGKGLVLA